MSEPNEPPSSPAEPAPEAAQADGEVSEQDLESVSGGCFIPLPILIDLLLPD